MDSSTILMILKYAGIGISGAAGISGTVTETKDKKTGRLNSWGKLAFGLAIAGFVVALGSQIAEHINNKSEQKKAEDDKKAAKKTAEDTESRMRTQLEYTEKELALTKQLLGVTSSTAASVE